MPALRGTEEKCSRDEPAEQRQEEVAPGYPSDARITRRPIQRQRGRDGAEHRCGEQRLLPVGSQVHREREDPMVEHRAGRKERERDRRQQPRAQRMRAGLERRDESYEDERRDENDTNDQRTARPNSRFSSSYAPRASGGRRAAPGCSARPSSRPAIHW